MSLHTTGVDLKCGAFPWGPKRPPKKKKKWVFWLALYLPYDFIPKEATEV